MTTELKCPHCGETLRQSRHIEPLTGQNLYFCGTHDCYPTECVIGTESMWKVLIKARQNLEIAIKTLKGYEMAGSFDHNGEYKKDLRETTEAYKALKQIEYKELA